MPEVNQTANVAGEEARQVLNEIDFSFNCCFYPVILRHIKYRRPSSRVSRSKSRGWFKISSYPKSPRSARSINSLLVGVKLCKDRQFTNF